MLVPQCVMMHRQASPLPILVHSRVGSPAASLVHSLVHSLRDSLVGRRAGSLRDSRAGGLRDSRVPSRADSHLARHHVCPVHSLLGSLRGSLRDSLVPSLAHSLVPSLVLHHRGQPGSRPATHLANLQVNPPQSPLDSHRASRVPSPRASQQPSLHLLRGSQPLNLLRPRVSHRHSQHLCRRATQFHNTLRAARRPTSAQRPNQANPERL